MFGDLDWPLITSQGFVSISRASCWDKRRLRSKASNFSHSSCILRRRWVVLLEFCNGDGGSRLPDGQQLWRKVHSFRYNTSTWRTDSVAVCMLVHDKQTLTNLQCRDPHSQWPKRAALKYFSVLNTVLLCKFLPFYPRDALPSCGVCLSDCVWTLNG